MSDPLEGKRRYLFFKRIFDVLFSLLGLLVLSPLLGFIALGIFLDGRGPVLFTQDRLGRNGKPFRMIKFRTMYRNAHTRGLITIGNRDKRITRLGYYLRKYKLDELPQLWNILTGDMSFVGPRPEVIRYVRDLPEHQKAYFRIRPGLTSYAALVYVNVNEMLARSDDPEDTYRREIMPRKVDLNLKYLEEIGLWTDLRILFRTLPSLFERFR